MDLSREMYLKAGISPEVYEFCENIWNPLSRMRDDAGAFIFAENGYL